MMTREQIIAYLQEDSLEQALLNEARAVRYQTKGHGVYLRGLIELSSCCLRDCLYCGMRKSNPKVHRYAMSDDEIVACAKMAQTLRFGTVVLQAGENELLWTRDRVAQLVRRIKAETNQRVTLSLGERSEADTAAWREAGADRYLLRFETTDRALFARIHPGAPETGEHPRLAQLRWMKAQGYEIGSGVMLGIPGQTLASVVDDLLTFQDLQLDMVGLGPYLRHPDTPLGQEGAPPSEVPVSVAFTCRCYALARLLLPHANIPSTTALSSLDPVQGRVRGLSAGTNVFMPNLTPACYRVGYQIYPDKICVVAPQADSLESLHATLAQLGLHQEEG